MFSKKSIRVEIQKIAGVYTPFSGKYTFSNLPVEVKISKVGMPAGYSARVNIYGVSKEVMNSITTSCWISGTIDEIAAVIYVNDGNGEHTLFVGQVMSAVPDYSKAPDTCISITLSAGAFPNLRTDVPPSSPTSDKEEVSVHQVFQDICDQYGVKLVDLGVVGTCKYPRPEGDGLGARLAWAAKAYNVSYFVENGSVTIYPRTSFNYRQEETISWTKNDYIGYPSFTEQGVMQIVLDRVPFTLQCGYIFTLSGSDVAAANDRWCVNKIVFDLSTKIGGKWNVAVFAMRAGLEESNG